MRLTLFETREMDHSLRGKSLMGSGIARAELTTALQEEDKRFTQC
jgi:hypothetical protein